MLLSYTSVQILQKHLIISSQQLHTAVTLYKNSLSSDSSDSDSDNKLSKKYTNSEFSNKKNINTMQIQHSEEKSLKFGNLIVSPKNIKLWKVIPQAAGKDLYNKKVVDAAKNITAQLPKNNRMQVESDLLALAKGINKNKKSASPSNISNIITGMKIEGSTESNELLRKITMVQHLSQSKSVIGKLSSEWNKKIKEDYSYGNALSIFHNNFNVHSQAPKMPTWELLQQIELQRTMTQPSRNVFQEMIQWTEEGKLWNFPIDNEQGMINEERVHFSQHVFVDRHLKEWCPKKGPIRHFMELVCVGLSKNPYLTVKEKIEHLTWFKDYFKQHTELLHDAGIIDISDVSKTKQHNI